MGFGFEDFKKSMSETRVYGAGGEDKSNAEKRVVREEKPRRTHKESEEVGMSRRKFLKLGAGATVAGLASLYNIPDGAVKVLAKIEDFFDSMDLNKERTEGQIAIEDSNNIVFADVAAEEILEEIKEDLRQYQEMQDNERDNESLEEKLAYKSRPIRLNGERMQEKLRGKWLDYYDVGGRGHNDLIDAYSRMQVYIGDLKRIFREEEVPEKYLYLAIPESHFDSSAKSWAAVGAYQFTLKTAEEVGLAKAKRDRRGNVTEVIFDYRKDVLKSARACAEYLRKKYDQCGDWRLAVAAYNGIVGNFFLAEKDKEERNYNSFVEFIEFDLNNKKKEVEGEGKCYEYKARGGTDVELLILATEFKTSAEILKRDNGITKDKLQAGQKIRIVLRTDEQRMVAFEKIANLSGLSENFNYPAKFEAVWELIQRAESSSVFGKNYLFDKEIFLQAKIDKDKNKCYNYAVKGGDTLFSIARDHVEKNKLNIPVGKMVEIIKRENNLSSDVIKLRQKLKIPYKV